MFPLLSFYVNTASLMRPFKPKLQCMVVFFSVECILCSGINMCWVGMISSSVRNTNSVK